MKSKFKVKFTQFLQAQFKKPELQSEKVSSRLEDWKLLVRVIQIIEKLLEMEFGFDIGDRPISHIVDADTVILNYMAQIDATEKIKRINTIIENDSCKIIFHVDKSA